jgi:hypothetical protein
MPKREGGSACTQVLFGFWILVLLVNPDALRIAQQGGEWVDEDV